MGDQPVSRLLPTNRTTQTHSKCRQTSIPRVGFKPTIPVFKQVKMVHALHRTVTVIGMKNNTVTFIIIWGGNSHTICNHLWSWYQFYVHLLFCHNDTTQPFHSPLPSSSLSTALNTLYCTHLLLIFYTQLRLLEPSQLLFQAQSHFGKVTGNSWATSAISVSCVALEHSRRTGVLTFWLNERCAQAGIWHPHTNTLLSSRDST
jgi:hypothetical protein